MTQMGLFLSYGCLWCSSQFSCFFMVLQYGLAHEILVLIAKMQTPSLNAHASISSEARDLNFGLSLNLHVHPYFVYVISEGSGESVHFA